MLKRSPTSESFLSLAADRSMELSQSRLTEMSESNEKDANASASNVVERPFIVPPEFHRFNICSIDAGILLSVLLHHGHTHRRKRYAVRNAAAIVADPGYPILMN